MCIIGYKQSDYFGVVLAATLYLVSFQVQVVYPVLYISDEWTVFFRPVFLITFSQFYDFGAYPVEELFVFFFIHQSAGIDKYVSQH